MLRKNHNRTLKMEHLEDRRLMSGDVGIETVGNLLIITGTDARDKVDVSYSDNGQYLHVNVYAYVSGVGWDLVQSEDFGAASRNYLRFYGGAGDDIFTNETDIVTEAWGEAGDDRLIGGSAHDTLIGGFGDDTLYGNDGFDILYGNEGNDYLSGHRDRDQIFGDEGDDYINGGHGDDLLYGGDGNDSLYGYEGDDKLDGKDGNDRLVGGEGDDILKGGQGNDRLLGEGGNDSLSGSSGNDWLSGGHGNDSLYGSYGNDLLLGNAGNDYLAGDEGTDTLYGHAGNDFLYGGNDGFRDLLRGGLGADTFIQHMWSSQPTSSNRPFVIWGVQENILDFNGFAGDKIAYFN